MSRFGVKVVDAATVRKAAQHSAFSEHWLPAFRVRTFLEAWSAG